MQLSIINNLKKVNKMAKKAAKSAISAEMKERLGAVGVKVKTEEEAAEEEAEEEAMDAYVALEVTEGDDNYDIDDTKFKL